jgi:deoxycytidylate deaminase
MSAQRPFIKSVHAESNAIHATYGRSDFKGAVMYVARIASYGAAMSRPCARCEGSMRNAGIFKVVYTTTEGEIEQIVLNMN